MTKSDIPGVIAPPPLIFAGGLAVGGVIHLFWPLPFLSGSTQWVLALILIAGGLGLGFSAFRAMLRAHTPVDPYESPTAIVSDGPYRFSRNPIYLGFALISLGIACLVNTLWMIIILPIVFIILHFGVIRREERFLERKFGETYTRYKASVRRWL